MTAGRVPSGKNILEASELQSFSRELQSPVASGDRAQRRVRDKVCAACVPAAGIPHPPRDRAPRSCGAPLSASSKSDCGDGVQCSVVQCSAVQPTWRRAAPMHDLKELEFPTTRTSPSRLIVLPASQRTQAKTKQNKTKQPNLIVNIESL